MSSELSSSRRTGTRASNLGAALRAICAAAEPISRADVAARLGVTRATASALVEALLDAGLVRESLPVSGPKPGRPGRPLLPGNRTAALGLQVGVEGLGARLLALDGSVLAVSEEHAPRDWSPATVRKRLGRMATSMMGSAPGDTHVVGVGLAVPGLVEGPTVVAAPNLGWRHVGAHRLLGPGLFEQSQVANEAEAAALAVALERPGRVGAWSDFLYVSSEVGIGGAVVRGGEVLNGTVWPMELGHICVDAAGPPCPCGSTGCLEQYAGSAALAVRARMPGATVPRVLRAHAAGEPQARQAVADAREAFIVACASALNVVGLASIVVGGPLAQLIRDDEQHVAARISGRAVAVRSNELRLECLPENRSAPATGGALLVLSRLLADPLGWCSGV